MSTHYVWFDTEYTRLELESAFLLQVAVLITDVELTPLEPGGFQAFVSLPKGHEDAISDWVRQQIPHVVQGSQAEGLPTEQIDARLAAYLDEVLGPAPESIGQRPILAGNSVHADWYLARRFLPTFLSRLHYRLLDVSSFKTEWQHHHSGEAFTKDDEANLKRFFPQARFRDGIGQHDAFYDVQASIAELAYYRAGLNGKS
ncbi:MAG: exonuclease domain-containing protein [Planctomycetota bacterium]